MKNTDPGTILRKNLILALCKGFQIPHVSVAALSSRHGQKTTRCRSLRALHDVIGAAFLEPLPHVEARFPE